MSRPAPASLPMKSQRRYRRPLVAVSFEAVLQMTAPRRSATVAKNDPDRTANPLCLDLRPASGVALVRPSADFSMLDGRLG